LVPQIDEITSANTAPQPATAVSTTAGGQHVNGVSRRRPNSEEIAPNEHPPPAPQLGLFSRIFGDGLLAYTCYAALFVGVFNSGTNIMQIGRETLIAVSPNKDPNGNWVRFIGIFSLIIICLIQLFSSRAGRVLNRFLAIVKITFLVVLFGFGCAYINKHGRRRHFTEKIEGITKFNYAQALLVVLYSYDGWENATFVSNTQS
jgi:amino acid transporter